MEIFYSCCELSIAASSRSVSNRRSIALRSIASSCSLSLSSEGETSKLNNANHGLTRPWAPLKETGCGDCLELFAPPPTEPLVLTSTRSHPLLDALAAMDAPLPAQFMFEAPPAQFGDERI